MLYAFIMKQMHTDIISSMDHCKIDVIKERFTFDRLKCMSLQPTELLTLTYTKPFVIYA